MNNTQWICTTCHKNIKGGKLPSCAKANKITFPPKPPVLELTELKERLVSPRIPFMQLRELPRRGQVSIYANVVNVPADVNTTISVLPRCISDTEIIPLKLKRCTSNKHHYQFQTIRPKKVLDAENYLVETSDLFKEQGIHLDTVTNRIETENSSNSVGWSEFFDTQSKSLSQESNNNKSCPISEANIDNAPDCTIENECDKNVSSSNSQSNRSADQESYDDDKWCEVEERPSGNRNTLLQESDESEEGRRIFSFAPGEGQCFMIKTEFLSFPKIYSGERRPHKKDRTVSVQYSTICKSELRRQDTRAAKSIQNIFYKLKKLQIKQIQSTASISLRKCKTKGKNSLQRTSNLIMQLMN